MTTLKAKEIIKMSKEDREKKLKELRLELVRSKAAAAKGGGAKSKQIRKIIARILTINKSKDKKSEEELKNK